MIKTYSASVEVSDGKGDSSAVQIRQELSGYAYVFAFQGIAVVCRVAGDFRPHVVIVPSERWLDDLKDSGFEIIGILDAAADMAPEPRKA